MRREVVEAPKFMAFDLNLSDSYQENPGAKAQFFFVLNGTTKVVP
jgi:hypothetical protein